MERIPRQFYTQEFKKEAVQLVISGGLSVAEVGRRLSLSPQTLRNWISKQRDGKLLHSAGGTMTESWKPKFPAFARSWLKPGWRKKY